MISIKKTPYFVACRADFHKSSENVCCGQPYFYVCGHYPYGNYKYYNISFGLNDQDDYNLYVDSLLFTSEEDMLEIFRLIVEKFNDLQYEVSDNLTDTFSNYLLPLYYYLVN